jgi:riboflavin kinase/FMN adenylyltransferase
VRFFTSFADIPADFGPSAVTIGKFDGMHSGHRRVIDELCAVASAGGLTSAVLTFDRHPLAVLNPEICPPRLTSNEQKRELLESSGIDAAVMIEFTREFSHLTPEEFVQGVLVNGLHARVVLVGRNFRFGRGGSGDVELLKTLGEEHGFTIRSIDEVKPDGDRAISSTWIRDLLSAGRVREAAALLGRAPSVRGVVVHGAERGRALGYPTANLEPEVEGFIPADGVYAGQLIVDGEAMPSAVSVGNNPTFDGVPEKQVEAHVLDRTIDLYGKRVEVSFAEYIRGMLKFANAEELVAQMRLDERRIRDVLGTPAAR